MVCGEGIGAALIWGFLPQGYLPANMERRKLTLQRKREEYFGFIQQYYDSRNEEHHQDTYRQVPVVCLALWPLATACFGVGVIPGLLPVNYWASSPWGWSTVLLSVSLQVLD